jgi:hypothetical protein
MKRFFTRQTICILAILLSSSLEARPIQAQDQAPTVAPGTDAMMEGDIAAGSVEDTLRACMGRIPKDASIGQVMIAEQSCWRDENERKPVQAIPGARSSSLTGPGPVAMGNDGPR